jgi:hypothetical protein
MEWTCGTQGTGGLPGYYCFDYSTIPSLTNTNVPVWYQPNVGQYYNATDASDFAGDSPWTGTDLLAGGHWRERVYSYRLTNGDQVRLAEAALNQNSLAYNVDQLADGKLHTITNVTTIGNTNDGFDIVCTSADHATWPTQCPVAGQPFTGYTRNGIPIANEPGHAIAYRPQYDPGPGAGYVDPNYPKYGKMVINGLQILGYDVHSSQAETDIRQGATPGPGQGAYQYEPYQWWDPTIVVPR